MDLEKLNLNSSDIENLENMGVTSVESLALLEPSEIPWTKQKSEYVIQNARSAIASQNIQDIRIKGKYAEVTSKVNLEEENNFTIEKSIKSILNLDEGCSTTKVKGKRIITTPSEGATHVWRSRVFLQLKKWANIIKSAKERKSKKEKLGLTVSPKKLKKFARENGFDGFWRTVFHEIQGNEIMKKALTVALFSSVKEPIHVAVIGPPASAKSLARDIIAKNFTNIQTIGANVTRAGLVMNYATGEKGALATADGQVVLADEFDKVQSKEIEYVYNLMSAGRCEVHAGNIHQEIESKFILIATMNPEGQEFSFDPISDIGLEPTLVSRFGLVVKTKELEKVDRMELSREKFWKGSELSRHSDKYDQWVKLAREYDPKIVASENAVEDYLLKVDEIIREFKNTPLRRDLRMQDYQRRIPFSIARAEFKQVDEEVLDEAWDIIRKSVKAWK